LEAARNPNDESKRIELRQFSSTATLNPMDVLFPNVDMLGSGSVQNPKSLRAR
jgi:hypothetical protein